MCIEKGKKIFNTPVLNDYLFFCTFINVLQKEAL